MIGTKRGLVAGVHLFEGPSIWPTCVDTLSREKISMRRRHFLGAVGGVAALWSGTVFAQHSDRLRRIGILHDYPEGELEGCSQIT
jgi:hypothetical protein